MKKKKIGLALGGGGARGLAHVGVLKVLQKSNVEIDYIAGSSMGAMVGAVHALGIELSKIEGEVLNIGKRGIFNNFIDIGIPNKSILKGNKVKKYIESLVGDATFRDVKIPFKIITTDLNTGEDFLIDKGSIAEAILISVSVPGIFPPVKYGKRFLVDGGISNATPIDIVDKMGADVIIGVDLMTKIKSKIENPNIISTLFQAYELIRTQQIKTTYKKYKNKTILIIPEVRNFTDSFMFHNVKKFIDSGEKATLKKIKEIEKLNK